MGLLPPAGAPVRAAFRRGRDLQGATVRLTEDALLGTLDLALSSRLAEEAVARTLRSPVVDVLGRELVRRDVVARIGTPVLDSPAAEHLVLRVLDGRMVDRVVISLLESEALWVLVEEIAASPAVTAAITQQSLGFAGQVGDDLRTRSERADDVLERVAQRARHPRRRPPAPRGEST